MLITIALLLVTTLLFAYLAYRYNQTSLRLQMRYSAVTDVEQEVAKAQAGLADAQRSQAQFEAEAQERRRALNQQYVQAQTVYQSLQKEVALFENNLEDISFGIYKPHFTYETPEKYKQALEQYRNRARDLVRKGQAAVCSVNWTVGNSKSEGNRMAKQYEKLVLRAFNGECEAALADVSWNNAARMEERIRKSFEAINKLGEVMHVTLTAGYMKLKLMELQLTHEYQDKRYQEKEEQRRIREQIREEERAQKEIEKAKEDAEAEETTYQKALAQVREEAAKATGAQLQKLTEQVSSFEAKLDEARRKKERAIARAPLTKSGFVYVISNIGAFGENVVKIGMTRRMEPMERIDELGGASVPFPFDLHVMLYSDNAPELETALHQLFADRRMNLVNPRKEFYREVRLEEVEAFIKKRGLSAQFVEIPEARQYRETMAQRQQQAAPQKKEPNRFAQPLFETANAS
jgi:hypothetical protein